MLNQKNKAIFFDRDGVVNLRIVGEYVQNYNDFHFCPDFFQFFKFIKSLGYLAIIITNQQGIGKGLMSESELNSIHDEMQTEIKKTTGYKIVSLQHIDEFVKGDLQFGDVTPYDVGPQDFVSLISNAEIVLTDSFHGTMFSVYYSKTFFTFPRYTEGKKDSTNSRIASILELMQLSDRKLNGDEDISDCLGRTVNWEHVQNTLFSFRQQSHKWLLDSLCDGGVSSR